MFSAIYCEVVTFNSPSNDILVQIADDTLTLLVHKNAETVKKSNQYL